MDRTNGELSMDEFSRRSGLAPNVLRRYAEAGVLLPAVTDPAAGHRYATAQLEEASTVRLLRRAGVALPDIASFLASPSAGAVDGWERSLTAETLSRREALAEVRRRLGAYDGRPESPTAIRIRPVRDLGELGTAFDLLGAQFPDPFDTSDERYTHLVSRFPSDQPLMLIATTADGEMVGGALASCADGAVALHLIGVVDGSRRRGVARRLVERVEGEARRRGARTVALGAGDEVVRFWCHLGYTPNLLFQWAHDPDRYQAESEAVLSGPLADLRTWRSSANDVPQLFVELDERRLDLRDAVRMSVTGCDVGFMMAKTLADGEAPPE